MSRFKGYSPDQSYLLPPSVRDELGEEHLCFFIRRVVERLDLSAFLQSYSAEGGSLYPPELMLGVWLYAYAVGLTSARQLERRMVEDLALRYLSGGARVDNWALSAFRRRHARALNDCFTQVLEMARSLGLGKLGRVAIDSTRIQASACRDKIDSLDALRSTRAHLRRQIRRWQKAADQDDNNESGGFQVAIAALDQALTELPPRLERLKKSGLKKMSRTDGDARFLRQRSGFVLGYTAEIAVSDDHLIVAQRVGQQAVDNASLLPMIELVDQQCGQQPEQLVADSGYFSCANLAELEARQIDAYLPDSNLAQALNLGIECKATAKDPAHYRMRQKMISAKGRATYSRRKATVEPVFGVLKQQRNIRQFRTRGLDRVGTEFTLATIAYNLTRLHTVQRDA
jgi:transposase